MGGAPLVVVSFTVDPVALELVVIEKGVVVVARVEVLSTVINGSVLMIIALELVVKIVWVEGVVVVWFTATCVELTLVVVSEAVVAIEVILDPRVVVLSEA